MAQFGIRKYKALYSGVSVMTVLIVIVATGGGLFGSETYWLADWQHRVFHTLCHQDPLRSFRFNGTPMAVCSRCYGIYISFAGAWLSIPFFGSLFKNNSFYRKALLAAILLNIMDVVGNLLGFWQNTLVSRFLMGCFIGVAAVVILAGDFIHNKS